MKLWREELNKKLGENRQPWIIQGSRTILGSQNPDLKINKFLVISRVLLKTQPYMVTSLFPNKASRALFPDNKLMEFFRPCFTVFLKFYSSTGHRPDRSLTTLTLVRSRGTQGQRKNENLVNNYRKLIHNASHTHRSEQ